MKKPFINSSKKSTRLSNGQFTIATIPALLFLICLMVSPSHSKPETKPTVKPESTEAAPDEEFIFDAVELGGTLVIEGKVEKPQVQFPLLMEKPPRFPISLEESFRDKMLVLERENVPDPELTKK